MEGEKENRQHQKNNISKEVSAEDLSVEHRLHEIGEIEIVKIKNSKEQNYKIWKRLIEKYHYLGHGRL